MISWISGVDERIDFVLPDYLVMETSGFGGSPVQLQTLQGLGQSGVTLVDQLLEPRVLRLIILVEGSSRGEVENKRRELLRLFNAQLGLGRIRWGREVGGIYEIEVIVKDIEFVASEDFGQFHEEVEVELVAPDPCWFEPTINTKIIDSSPITITNKGDIFTSTKIVVSGPAENVIVKNKTTGEKMTLVVSLTVNQKLEVNSKIGGKEISLITANDERVNYFKVLTPGSDFITLAPGVNELTCNLIGGQIEITYYHRYLGI